MTTLISLKQDILTAEDIKLWPTFKVYNSMIRVRSKKIHQHIQRLDHITYSNEANVVLFMTLLYSPETDWASKGIKTTTDFLNYLQTCVNSFIADEHLEYIVYGIELHKGYKVTKAKDANDKFVMELTEGNDADGMLGYPHLHLVLVKSLGNVDETIRKSVVNDYIQALYTIFDSFDVDIQWIQQSLKTFVFKRKFIYVLKECSLNEQYYPNKYRLFTSNDTYIKPLTDISNYFSVPIDRPAAVSAYSQT